MSNPKSYLLKVVTETTIDELAENIHAMIHDHDDLLEFILRVDEVAADLHFSEELHRRLGESIAAEYSDEPLPVSVTEEKLAKIEELCKEDWEGYAAAHVIHSIWMILRGGA